MPTSRTSCLRLLALFALLPFHTVLGAAPAADTAVRTGTLIDVDAGRVLSQQVILLAGDRIVAIQDASVPLPATLRVIDWSRYTVLPGLSDVHTHLIGDIQSANVAAPLMSTGARDALIGAIHAEATLKAGFTSVRDVGTYRAFVDVALREQINTGLLRGPRMMVAGAYVTISGGGGEVTGMAPDVIIPADFRRGVANNADEVRARVRELIAGGADFIKMIATGAVLTMGTTPGAAEFSEKEIHAAVEEAQKYGKDVTAHAHGADGIKAAVRAGVRSIEHGSLIDDEGIALMKKRGTWLVADIYNGDYIAEVGSAEHWPAEILEKNRQTTDAQREGFRKAVKAGVNIAFGTDAGVFPHGDNGKQLAYMVRYGQTPMQAIQSATISNARLMRKDTDIGSIAVGKYADLVAVDGDVLANIRLLERPSAVTKGGVLIQ
ncbi:amidohydrolase family protein [Permianibacter sp. IMCC34836]|uniref:Xaa-Pro dipeptidase n=1 Tax=Permianibacter fluminis TaxID=2738515 RepID=UPI0015539712|nr:amidohydrolase family protein [Permianibacter fluminis]NQD36373.1 amidohydrolase family protein [Permianibacter fluminis]